MMMTKNKKSLNAAALLEEARLQQGALKQLRAWQRNAMIASSCGVVLAWWGLTGGGTRLILGIAGMLMMILGILCAAVIGLGIRNGRRNVEQLLHAAKNLPFVSQQHNKCRAKGDKKCRISD